MMTTMFLIWLIILKQRQKLEQKLLFRIVALEQHTFFLVVLCVCVYVYKCVIQSHMGVISLILKGPPPFSCDRAFI